MNSSLIVVIFASLAREISQKYFLKQLTVGQLCFRRLAFNFSLIFMLKKALTFGAGVLLAWTLSTEEMQAQKLQLVGSPTYHTLASGDGWYTGARLSRLHYDDYIGLVKAMGLYEEGEILQIGATIPVFPPGTVVEPTRTFHEVAKGEWLSKIARTYGVTVQEIIDASRQCGVYADLTTKTVLQVGDIIAIPTLQRPAKLEITDQDKSLKAGSYVLLGQKGGVNYYHYVRDKETAFSLAQLYKDEFGVTTEDFTTKRGDEVQYDLPASGYIYVVVKENDGNMRVRRISVDEAEAQNYLRSLDKDEVCFNCLVPGQVVRITIKKARA